MLLPRFFAVFAALAALISSATSSHIVHNGACVKMASSDGKGTQYYARIPQGSKYSHPRDVVPGNTFKKHLKSCNLEKFECIYDNEGNAHVDFIVKSRNRWFAKNKCNVDAVLNDATDGEFTVNCIDGSVEKLADAWRDN
ncbi:hypothetical protein CMQ_4252 [Grosmannia clavigera kw1407]|uniref:Uncharacterized protein n=1 Tax=Grosmannia clavigera (strain kw1407 / UAMH 11150) TaxID=655863 RepID=F0XV62_GROCL|nr:uncharacterized protein CMQ_4252 [Grosmannia clavigera kw1407]EFW98400.1 hypothetical protein CMQ_4252 [Grosmannia clavigera kw1407]